MPAGKSVWSRVLFSVSPAVRNPLIHGNSVKPCVETTSSFERLKLSERDQKRFLRDILRFFRATNDVCQRIEQSVLIFLHQITKRGRIAAKRLFDKSVVVVHVLSVFLFDDQISNEVPRKRWELVKLRH